jgi:hypothetical protein
MTRPRLASAALTAAFAALAPATAPAHHGAPGYDRSQVVVVDGTVAQLDWKNPHVYFTVETRGENGQIRRATVEGGTLSTMRAFGLTREQLAAGAHVTVRALAKQKGLVGPMLGISVTLDDGSVFNLGPGPSVRALRVAAAADGLAGKWAASSSAVDEFIRALTTWPYADARLRTASDPAAPPPDAGRCYTEVPVPWQYVYGGLQTIEISDSTVVLRAAPYGFLNERVVHLDQTAHPEGIARSMLGHSIGRWEGETLVVDTVALEPFPTNPPPRGPRARLVERFTLTEDRRQIRYEITMEDPDLLTAPATFATLWDHRPDLAFEGDEGCDEEQARRFRKE